MAKNKLIREGILTKFVSTITQNIINKQRQKNQKALKNDPKLKKLEAEFAQAVDKFQKGVEAYTGKSREDFAKKYGS
jgi:hypothetical protein